MLERAAIVLLLMSCGSPPRNPDGPTVATLPIERTVSVAPGQFAELNLELDAGATVVIDFMADAAVDWNIHSHPAGSVVIHVQGSAESAHMPFSPETPGGYSWLWENKGAAPLELTVRGMVQGPGRIHSWVPAL